MQDFVVVIPYYNKEALIGNCLDSIHDAFNRSWFDIGELNVIIVDDGSKVRLRASDIKTSMPMENVHVVNKSNEGCAQARITGIDYAKFLGLNPESYVLHIDPDDTITPDAFDQIGEWITKFPNVDVLIGNLIMYDVGVYNPYYCTPYRSHNAKALGKVYEAKHSDLLKCNHPVVYKYCKLKHWMNIIDKCDLRINCAEDLFLSSLLYNYVKTVVYTDIAAYVYAFGEPSSIMTNNKQVEPRDSKVAYTLAILLEALHGT